MANIHISNSCYTVEELEEVSQEVSEVAAARALLQQSYVQACKLIICSQQIVIIGEQQWCN